MAALGLCVLYFAGVLVGAPLRPLGFWLALAAVISDLVSMQSFVPSITVAPLLCMLVAVLFSYPRFFVHRVTPALPSE